MLREVVAAGLSGKPNAKEEGLVKTFGISVVDAGFGPSTITIIYIIFRIKYIFILCGSQDEMK